jgi:hypothetical protein
MRAELNRAVAAGIITADQAERLAAFMSSPGPAEAQARAAGPRFDAAHVLWYLGALIVMGAMGLFSTLAFGAMGAPALLATAVIYGGGLAAAGRHLWHRRGLRTPGGLLVTAAVAMAPLGVFALQDMFGWWTTAGGQPGRYQSFFTVIKGGWLPMEIATLAACAVALRFYRFPFILFVAAVMIWFMSMDVADLVRGTELWASWEVRRNVSLVFGLAMIAVAWAVDIRRTDQDFGFWLHLVGAVTFFGGLSLQNSGSEIGKLVYCLICVGLIAFSVFLSRRVYAVFGGVGLFGYVGHLAWRVFDDVLIFPFVMSAFGIGVIWLGIKFHRNADRIGAWVEANLPAWLKRLRPAVRV